MDLVECYPLGSLKRTHGTDGSLILQLGSDLPDKNLEREPVFIRVNQADESLVPFFIDSIRKHGKSKAIIRFEDYEDMERASGLCGMDVFLPLSYRQEDPDIDDFDLTGFMVIDNSMGELGEVIEVIENPAQSLLKVSHGKKELLIPLVEGIIMEIHTGEKEIITELPEGLVDMNP